MGQISAATSPQTGSVLSGNQHPEKLAAERFGQQPFRTDALEAGQRLITLLVRARDGFDRALSTAASLPVGRTEVPDYVPFLVEALYGIWVRLGQGRPATQSKRRDQFGGFVAACEELVAEATGIPLKPTTIHNAVIAHLRRLSADNTSSG